MTMIENLDRQQKLIIDLNGPQGNAYFLLGTASHLANQLGLDWPAIDADMTSGNYKHLVETFDKHFGEIYDLILPDNWSSYE